jgi:hypothetical protein
MLNVISTLLQWIWEALKILLGFLAILALGLVAAVLYALPWLLRAAALLLWLTAGYLGVTSIQTIYSPFSPAIPVIALQFAVILILVAWMGLLLREQGTSHLWGGLAAGGLTVSGASVGMVWLSSHWPYANLFFRILPASLFSVLLITETVRLRSLRHNGKVILTAPTFVWLKRRTPTSKEALPDL